MEKIGLVLEGGGMRGAYTAGALAWLSDHNITFDYNVGISSGAVYVCCYMLNDKETAYEMATHAACEKGMVGFKAILKEGHYVAYKHMFKDIIVGKFHFSLDPIYKQKMPVEIGMYNLEKGKTEYFGPDNMEPNDPDLKLLNGACALPVASAIVEYQGHHYLDGGITKMIPIERAQEVGCTKFVVITTKPADYVRKPASFLVRLMMKVIYRKYPSVEKDYAVRHINYYKQVDIINDLKEKGKAIQILPTKTVNVNRWKGDEVNTKILYDLGYQDMEDRKDEILAFVQK